MVILLSPEFRGNQLNKSCSYPPVALQYTKSKLKTVIERVVVVLFLNVVR